MKKSIKSKPLTLPQSLNLIPFPKGVSVLVQLEEVMLEWSPEGVYLSGGDLESFARVLYRVKLPQFETFFMDAKDLKQHKSLETVSYSERSAVVNGITYAAHQKFDEYPKYCEEGHSFHQLNCMANKPLGIIPKGLEKYASKDEMRQAMRGINLSPRGWAATNAHILIWVKSRVEGIEDIIIPSKPYLLASKAEGSMYFHVITEEKKIGHGVDERIIESQTHIIIANGDGSFVLISRLIEAKFPDYTQVIPRTETAQFAFKFGPQINSELDKCSKVWNKNTREVKMKYSDGSMLVNAQDLDYNKEYNGVVHIDVVKRPEEAVDFGINGVFLRDILDINDTFYFDGKRPIVFESPDQTKIGVICPNYN